MTEEQRQARRRYQRERRFRERERRANTARRIFRDRNLPHEIGELILEFY
jgi:hypothetical protein